MNPTPFDMLARRDDPITSRLAARRVDLRLTGAHRWLLDWLQDRTATEDEMAAALVEAALVVRHERGRRVARTLRERHDAIEAVLDENGSQQMRANRSGRLAFVWTISDTGRRLLAETPYDSMLVALDDDRPVPAVYSTPAWCGWWVFDRRFWHGPYRHRDAAQAASDLLRARGDIVLAVHIDKID